MNKDMADSLRPLLRSVFMNSDIVMRKKTAVKTSDVNNKVKLGRKELNCEG